MQQGVHGDRGKQKLEYGSHQGEGWRFIITPSR